MLLHQSRYCPGWHGVKLKMHISIKTEKWLFFNVPIVTYCLKMCLSQFEIVVAPKSMIIKSIKHYWTHKGQWYRGKKGIIVRPFELTTVKWSYRTIKHIKWKRNITSECFDATIEWKFLYSTGDLNIVKVEHSLKCIWFHLLWLTVLCSTWEIESFYFWQTGLIQFIHWNRCEWGINIGEWPIESHINHIGWTTQKKKKKRKAKRRKS